jgi:hypothetical protein
MKKLDNYQSTGKFPDDSDFATTSKIYRFSRSMGVNSDMGIKIPYKP